MYICATRYLATYILPNPLLSIQLGDENGRTYNRQPYMDYTGYEPVNTAYEVKKNETTFSMLMVGKDNIGN